MKPESITIVGTSMGGYIAQYVATKRNNPKLKFVLIGYFMDNDLASIPEIQLSDNILGYFGEISRQTRNGNSLRL